MKTKNTLLAFGLIALTLICMPFLWIRRKWKKINDFVIYILVGCLLMTGCQVEPVGESLQDGYLSFHGKFQDLSTFKEVPECSGFIPNELYVRMIKPINGTVHTATVPITIVGNEIFADEPMPFEEGTYLKEEVSLRFNGIVTHTAPYEVDPRFDFGSYVERTLPYEVEIVAGQTTESSDQVLCFSVDPIELNGDFEWVGTVEVLRTMYFHLPEDTCIELVTIEIDSYRIVEMPIFEFGLLWIPIPETFNYFGLRAYYIDDFGDFVKVEQDFEGTEYNADGVMNQDDILFFEDNCTP